MQHSIAGLTFVLLLGSTMIVAAQQLGARLAESSERVLERGPVHEAFAEVISLNPQPGVIAPRRPAEAEPAACSHRAPRC